MGIWLLSFALGPRQRRGQALAHGHAHRAAGHRRDDPDRPDHRAGPADLLRVCPRGLRLGRAGVPRLRAGDAARPGGAGGLGRPHRAGPGGALVPHRSRPRSDVGVVRAALGGVARRGACAPVGTTCATREDAAGGDVCAGRGALALPGVGVGLPDVCGGLASGVAEHGVGACAHLEPVDPPRAHLGPPGPGDRDDLRPAPGPRLWAAGRGARTCAGATGHVQHGLGATADRVL